MPLETDATAELRGLIADLKPRDASLLEALHRVQRRYGYIPAEAMAVIGERLRLSPAHVYGVTTYYSELRTAPPPAHTLAWCSGLSCLLKGSAEMLRGMEAALGCRLGARTADGRVELVRGQCNGTCELAPQVWVDGRVIGGLTAAAAVTLARALAAGEDPGRALARLEQRA